MVAPTTYYGGIDSAVDGAGRAFVQTSGLMMIGLLLHEQRPVLSQTQAFDNTELLGVIGDGSSEDAVALLDLFRSDIIRVRLFAGTRRDSGEATLLGAFADALTNDFRLSAWPEIDRDRPAREALAEHLRRVEPDQAQDGIEQVADGDLAARLAALIELDRALRRSEEPELAVPVPGPALFDRSMQALRSIGRGDDAAAAVARHVSRRMRMVWLSDRAGWAWGAVSRSRRAPTNPTFVPPHERRTVWRKVLEQVDGSPIAKSTVSGVVDLAYHLTIAGSLGASHATVRATSEPSARLAAEAWAGTRPAIDSVRWTEDDLGFGVSWAVVRDALGEHGALPDGPERWARMEESCLGLVLADVDEEQRVAGLQARVSEIGGALVSTALFMVRDGTPPGPGIVDDVLLNVLAARVTGAAYEALSRPPRSDSHSIWSRILRR